LLTFIFHKIVWRHINRIMGHIIIIVLQIVCRVFQWKNFENRSTIGKDAEKSEVNRFYGPQSKTHTKQHNTTLWTEMKKTKAPTNAQQHHKKQRHQDLKKKRRRQEIVINLSLERKPKQDEKTEMLVQLRYTDHTKRMKLNETDCNNMPFKLSSFCELHEASSVPFFRSACAFSLSSVYKQGSNNQMAIYDW